MKIENSSAISEINFGKDHGIIGITFRQGKEYDFSTDYADEVKADIESAVANGDSVGSLIADLRKEGTLTAVTTA